MDRTDIREMLDEPTTGMAATPVYIKPTSKGGHPPLKVRLWVHHFCQKTTAPTPKKQKKKKTVGPPALAEFI